MSLIEEALEKARKEAGRSHDVRGPLAAGTPGGRTASHDAGQLFSGLTGYPQEPVAPRKNSLRAPGREPGCAPEDAPDIRIKPGPAVVTANKAPGFMGEEYRLLKERLFTISRASRNMNVFMITSPMRNEGKTVVSCNLALSLAHDFDHTVLLIDADLRAPGCHRLLGLPRSTGLVDCLMGEGNFQDSLVHTGVGRLSFLSAGTATPNPAELFSSSLMNDLLHEMKHRYPDRFIIIDTSPILPFAETRALSRLVDGVILVARENVTLKAHLTSALQTLEGSNVLGIVYNDAGNFGTDKEVFNLCYTY